LASHREATRCAKIPKETDLSSLTNFASFDRSSVSRPPNYAMPKADTAR
jgi:hypothetical protein